MSDNKCSPATTTLLPCPFCGNEVIAEGYVRDGRIVSCMKCHASVRAFQPNAVAHAIAKWNTRASQPATSTGGEKETRYHYGDPGCCKGLALSECRCEIERKAAGHPPYQRSSAGIGDAAAWKEVAQRAGVCMTCALGAPEPHGCTDCLNTGWDGGAPHGFMRIPDAAQRPPEPKVILLLKIIEAAGGEVGCGDHSNSWLNYFCDDCHPTDTFNQAVDAKFLRVHHDDRFDASTAYLTDAGRSAVSSTAREAPDRSLASQDIELIMLREFELARSVNDTARMADLGTTLRIVRELFPELIWF